MRSKIARVTRCVGHHVDVLIRLIPNASGDQISGVIQVGEDEFRISVKVRAVPEKGKANKALIDLFAKYLGISKSSIEVCTGDTSRLKTLRIHADPKTISEKLAQFAG